MKAFRPLNPLLLFFLLFSGSPLLAGGNGAPTPDGAWRQFVHAMREADPVLALSVIDGTPQQIALVHDFLTCIQAVQSFRERFTAHYGLPEWERFRQKEDGSSLPVFHLPEEIPKETYREMIRQTVLPDGDAYRVPAQFGSARIIAHDGQWYLEAVSLGVSQLPYQDMTAVLRAFEPRIGAAGVSAAELRRAVKQALHKVAGRSS